MDGTTAETTTLAEGAANTGAESRRRLHFDGIDLLAEYAGGSVVLMRGVAHILSSLQAEMRQLSADWDESGTVECWACQLAAAKRVLFSATENLEGVIR